MQIEYKNINDLIFDKIVDVYGEWLKKDKKLFVRDDAFALAAMDGDVPVGYVFVAKVLSDK